MRRTTVTRTTGALAVAATAIVIALATSITTSATLVPHPHIPHPTGADAVVLTIHHELNGWGGEYRDGIDVTVYGDGRVVVGRAPRGPDDHPKQRTYEVGERGVQRLLRMATWAGLFTDTDYGNALVTDQGSSTITLHAGGKAREVSVYALLLDASDHFLEGDQQEARQALRRFVRDATHPGVRY